MADFSLSLDLVGALALFNLVDKRGSSAPPELDQIEAELRSYLYECLSIDEMEDPQGLYLKLRAGRKRACEQK
jgi:hypothetical protein